MRKFWLKLVSIAAAVVVAFSASSPTLRASADDVQPTDVMKDLQETTLNVDDYPTKTLAELKESGESFLQVIRVAESVTDELYIYVYQPCDEEKEIEAVKVVINQTADLEQTTAKVYDLQLVSTEGVFDKYLVKGLKVLSSLSLRHYAITSLMRKYDKSLGDEEKYGNQGGTTDYVPEAVAQIWYARTKDDGTREYAYTQDKVVTITDKFHGFIRYADGFKLWEVPFTDSHFIAFTSDHKIEDLLSAEVYYSLSAYVYRDYYVDGKDGAVKDEIISASNYKKLTTEDKGSNDADGWFGHRYEWDRIEELSSFRNSEDDALTDEAKTRLTEIQNTAGENGAWVLRFIETQYTEEEFLRYNKWGQYFEKHYLEIESTIVSNVAILKLTFRTAGITYTMGVVDTMVTPDTVPDGGHNETEWDLLFKKLKEGFNNLQKTLRGIGVAIGAIFAACILGGIAYGIITLINWIRDAVHRRRNK